MVTVTSSSDRFHILPAQIERHKQVYVSFFFVHTFSSDDVSILTLLQLRIREDLRFTVNAALGSIGRAPAISMKDPLLAQHLDEMELVKQQTQIRSLMSQNRKLLNDLAAAKKEMSQLRMELQLAQQSESVREQN